MIQDKPRWVYRLDNYNRAFLLLREAVEASRVRLLSQLEKEGTIQRFEFTLELAWKTLKDYLEYKGVVLETGTPADVIKAAFANAVIDNGDAWMKALKSRNEMSHIYGQDKFDEVYSAISDAYFDLLKRLHASMMANAAKEGFDV